MQGSFAVVRQYGLECVLNQRLGDACLWKADLLTVPMLTYRMKRPIFSGWLPLTISAVAYTVSRMCVWPRRSVLHHDFAFVPHVLQTCVMNSYERLSS